MQVGDLVQFQHCAQQGDVGIISMLTDPSPVSKINPELRLFWVLCDTGIQCFTGRQLALVGEKKIND
tara:strand:+ start:1162 stop:1362 length:201 start_codon:yes stop_codon:yes gene_type:complete